MQGAANAVEIVCYPYLRRQLASKRRGFIGSMFARIKLNPKNDTVVNKAIAGANLDNKFMEFEQWQGEVASLSKNLDNAQSSSMFSNLDIFFSPCANGRPPVSGMQEVDYKGAREYENLVVPEKKGDAGQLFRLPPVGTVLEHNLLSYLASPHLVGQQDVTGTSFAHFLFSGSTDFQWNNWQHDTGFSFQTGEVLDGKSGGWKNLEAMQVHDTCFFLYGDTMHAGIYLGGKMILHKPASDAPVWISTFREIMELGGGRWSDVHVKREFNPSAAKRFVAP